MSTGPTSVSERTIARTWSYRRPAAQGETATWRDESSHGYLDRFLRWLSRLQQPEASDQRRTALTIKKGDPLL
jgi:hypothetical protein